MNCDECGEFDCDIDHDRDEDWGDNSENDTGYDGDSGKFFRPFYIFLF